MVSSRAAAAAAAAVIPAVACVVVQNFDTGMNAVKDDTNGSSRGSISSSGSLLATPDKAACHCEGVPVPAPPHHNSTAPLDGSLSSISTTGSAKGLDNNDNDNDNDHSANSHTSFNHRNSAGFVLEDVYEIEAVLGEGSYGLVYKARRIADGVAVALKTMPRWLTGKTDFEREVAALQLLSNNNNNNSNKSGGTPANGNTTNNNNNTSSGSSGGPHVNIVQLYDLHRDDENYYLSMELIEGGELLEHLIQYGAYSEGLAASFLRQFAEAICFVHNNNLVHADLKPENLLLSKTGSNEDGTCQLKIADFGCARTHDESRQEMHLPAQEFARGCSFLHMVALGNQFELEKMLQERPNIVNFRDYDFRTPLHLAASEGHVDICRFLVERGARVNRSDRWG